MGYVTRAQCGAHLEQEYEMLRLRRYTADESGFTLIELLVVILIIGVLAAIALPAFLSQKSKADDAAAKTQVGTLQTSIETYSTENSGSYAGATIAKLEAIEPSLKDKSTATPSIPKAGAEEYEVESESVASKDKFKLIDIKGEVKRTCEPAGKGGCTAAKTW
jgi:type IV pilus assembly protein PilA